MFLNLKIYLFSQNNYPEVVKLFLQQQPGLLIGSTKDGNTCAHIAAMKGSVQVIEELMKFDLPGVITARNTLTDATPLELAAKFGHVDVVEALVTAGASCKDENRAGFTGLYCNKSADFSIIIIFVLLWHLHATFVILMSNF